MRTVHLHQFPGLGFAFAPLSMLLALTARLPQPFLDQPAPQRLVVEVVTLLGQVLDGQGRTKIAIQLLVTLQNLSASIRRLARGDRRPRNW